ncbi:MULTISPECIES: hypothetical protein [Halorussus]|uniref:DUF7576 family protein n=1 Tax=Halorussus TaxID=1070314 RepID=UPI000E213D97|nr:MULTISPECIES: hypothetical protein [Halorussus]NHN60484.1 hypothetical protein [Halorussus sp. JP-T4]
MSEDSIADASLREHPDTEADPVRICAACDAVVEDSDWHPATTRVTEAGEVVIYLFCTEGCKTEWQAARD